MNLNDRRRRGAIPKAKAESVELAPEILQVITVVAEIMLDHRHRQADARKASTKAA